MTTQPEALRLADRLDLWGDQGDLLEAAAELRRLHSHEFANEVWQVKTQWVQDTAKPEELGMHRADVMRQRLVRAEAQRDALLEALKLARPYISTYTLDGYHAEVKADAAIKAVEGEKG